MEKNNKTWNELIESDDFVLYYKYIDDYDHIQQHEKDQMKENYEVIRCNALAKMNNSSNSTFPILHMDVTDEQLFPYVLHKSKYHFFKYSRLLDFMDGNIPEEITKIEKFIRDFRSAVRDSRINNSNK